MTDKTEKMLRSMAWERAKGELMSMRHTFYNDHRFEEFDNALTTFVDAVESEALYE
jgi:hypothetical protein